MKIILSFLFTLVTTFCFAQSISGTVKDGNNNSIGFVNILIKEKTNPSQIVEFTNTTNGNFSISLKKSYKEILVEVNSHEFENETFTIQNPIKNKDYNIKFILSKKRIKEIEEVIISANKKRFVVKKDTISYNVESYKDQYDRKLQDVLIKIPGLEVNQKYGEIKYKGKSIETVTLDGDNLFGYNYSIGTKNINIDLVEQIEVIENYSDNALLQGIEGGEKVAINIKLKKEKTDYSGNIDLGLGINNDSKLLNNTSTTILGISKKYKSFGVLSFNNIGINQSPFDYFAGRKGLEEIKEQNLFAQKIISESPFGNLLDDERVNINNSLFINYNNLFKINKRLSLKTNLYYLTDNLKLNQSNIHEYKIGNDFFTTQDILSTIKKPNLYRGDIEVKFISSIESLIEYKAKFNYEKINTDSEILQNQSDLIQNTLKTENIYFNQKLIYTNRLKENQALQIQLNNAFSSAPQNLLFFEKNSFDFTSQNSNFKKKYLDAIISILKSSPNSKSSFSVGANYDSNPYNSNNNHLNKTNVVNLTKKSIYSLGSSNYTINNWSFIPTYSIRYLFQDLRNDKLITDDNNEILLFEPSFLIRYKINNISYVSSKVSYNQNPFSEEYIFKNPVFISNRLQLSNNPSLQIKKSQVYNFNYYNNNLYKQFFFNFSLNYQKNNSDFFSDYSINENQIILHNFYVEGRNDNLSFKIVSEKFIDLLSTTFKITSNFSHSNYKNIVNNSQLRENSSNNFNNIFTIRSAFSGKLNFENELSFNYFSNKSENSKLINNTSLTNGLKIKYNYSNNIFASFSGDYFLPNITNKNNSYLFLDFNIIFKPENKQYEVNLIGKNLLNNKIFTQIQTSDFSKNILQSNLISRYILVNFSYKL